MGRRTQNPVCYLAMPVAGIATAFGLQPETVREAVQRGEIECKTYPGTIARRILVADAEQWFREHWLTAKPRKRKVPKHV